MRFSPLGCIVRLLVVAIVILAIFLFLQSSFFDVATIEVRGLETLDETEVINLSGLQTGENIFKTDRKSAEEQIMLHAAIASVDIKIRPPKRVVIDITERHGIGVLHVDEWFYIVDAEGYIIDKRSSDAGYSATLSLLQELDLPRALTVGTKLESLRVNNALALANLVSSRYPDTPKVISVTKPNDIRCTFSGKEVRFGDVNKLEKKLDAMDEILQSLPTGGWFNLVYIDVSNPKDPYVESLEAPPTVNDTGVNDAGDEQSDTAPEEQDAPIVDEQPQEQDEITDDTPADVDAG